MWRRLTGSQFRWSPSPFVEVSTRSIYGSCIDRVRRVVDVHIPLSSIPMRQESALEIDSRGKETEGTRERNVSVTFGQNDPSSSSSPLSSPSSPVSASTSSSGSTRVRGGASLMAADEYNTAMLKVGG